MAVPDETSGRGALSTVLDNFDGVDDAIRPYKWYVFLLVIDVCFLIVGVALDIAFGKEVLGALIAAFAVLTGSIIAFIAMALILFRFVSTSMRNPRERG